MTKKKKDNSKLKAVLKDVKKQHKNCVISMGSDIKDRERISTGCPEVDELIGGGVPSGLFSVFWGSKGCGKTSLAYSTIAEAQKEDKTCLYLDLEHSYEEKRAKSFGIKTDDLIVAKFPKAENSMDAIITLCKEKAVDLIILDSIHSMSPTGEQETKRGKEKSVEDDTQALLARKLSQFFRMATHHVSTSNCAVVLIGQARMTIGSFINLEVLSGGNALLHFASLIVRMRRGKKADAPVEKYKHYYTDKEGKERYKTVKEPCGFNLVMKLDKTKVDSQREGTEIQIPFYFDGSFKQNKKGDEKDGEDS